MAYIYYNPNPQQLQVGDCVIRAVSKALNTTWNDVYTKIVVYGLMMSDMPSANRVWRQSYDDGKDQMMDQLYQMMDQAGSEKERQAIQKCIRQIEQG